MSSNHRTKPPRVFISYSHGEEDFMRSMRDLCTRLRADGIDAHLDQYEHEPRGQWPSWSARQIVRSDHVLLICTEQYSRSFMGLTEFGKGKGVEWEAMVMHNALYYRHLRTAFIPVIRSAGEENHIPITMRKETKAVLGHWSGEDSEGYNRLLARLGHRPGLPALEIPAPASSNGCPNDASEINATVWNELPKLQRFLMQFAAGYQPTLDRAEVLTVSGEITVSGLRYAYCWLDHHERKEAIRQLTAFMDAPEHLLWWGMVGHGGVGKSRTAFHLCMDYEKKGWQTGFLASGNTKWLEDQAAHWLPERDTLIIIDYASQYPKRVMKGLRALIKKYEEFSDGLPRLRVLLLDRPGELGALFSDLHPDNGRKEQAHELIKVRSVLYKSPAVGDALEAGVDLSSPTALSQREAVIKPGELLQLDELPASEWTGILQQVMTKQGAGSVRLPPIEREEWREWVAHMTGGGRFLYLQVLGIVLASRPEVLEEASFHRHDQSIIGDILELEYDKHWASCFEGTALDGTEHHLIPQRPLFNRVRQAVAFITLTRGLLLDEDKEALRLSVAFGDDDYSDLLKVLSRILRTNRRWSEDGKEVGRQLAPFEPDAIGEYLIISLFDPAPGVGKPRPLDQTAWLRHALARHPDGTYTTLRNMIKDFPGHPVNLAWVDAFLTIHADTGTLLEQWPQDEKVTFEALMAGTVFAVLRVNGEPDDTWFNAVIARATGDRALKDHLLIAALQELIDRADLVVEVRAVEKAIAGLLDLPYNDSNSSMLEVRALLSAGTAQQFFKLGASAGAGTASERAFDQGEEWAKRTIGAGENADGLTVRWAAQLAMSAINYYGTAKRFEDLERWGTQLQALAAQVPDDAQVQLEWAQGSVNAIIDYGTAKHFEDVERWGIHLQTVAARLSDDAQVQLELAKGSVKAMLDYGTAQRFEDLERWGAHLQSVAAQLPDDPQVQLELAKGSINAISHYGTAQCFEELERWGAHLQSVAARLPEDPQVQLELAKGSVNAINHCGTAQRFEDLERWGAHLQSVAARLPDDSQLQLALAKGSFNAICHYGTAQRFEDLERWGAQLQGVTARLPDDPQVQLELAKGSYNAIIDYGTALRFEDLERWGAHLQSVAARLPGDPQVQQTLASVSVNAIGLYGTALRFEDVERWGAYLRFVAARLPVDLQVQMALAKGSVNAIGRYAKALRFEDLERWGAHLQSVAARLPDDPQVQLALAMGSVNALSQYGTAQRLEELERWGDHLQSVAARLPDDPQVQLELAKGSVNAMSLYGTAQRFADLERWGAHLQSVAARLPDDPQVQLELAKGSVHAIVAYQGAPLAGPIKSWYGVLKQASLGAHVTAQHLDVLCLGFEHFGDAAMAANEIDTAIEVYSNRFIWREQLHKAFPENAATNRELALAHYDLFMAHWRLEQWRECIAHALAVVQTLGAMEERGIELDDYYKRIGEQCMGVLKQFQEQQGGKAGSHE